MNMRNLGFGLLLVIIFTPCSWSEGFVGEIANKGLDSLLGEEVKRYGDGTVIVDKDNQVYRLSEKRVVVEGEHLLAYFRGEKKILEKINDKKDVSYMIVLNNDEKREWVSVLYDKQSKSLQVATHLSGDQRMFIKLISRRSAVVTVVDSDGSDEVYFIDGPEHRVLNSFQYALKEAHKKKLDEGFDDLKEHLIKQIKGKEK